MFRKITQFLSEVRVEMGKVTWPTRDELTSSTTIVLGLTLVLALFIMVVDFVLSTVMSQVLV